MWKFFNEIWKIKLGNKHIFAKAKLFLSPFKRITIVKVKAICKQLHKNIYFICRRGRENCNVLSVLIAFYSTFPSSDSPRTRRKTIFQSQERKWEESFSVFSTLIKSIAHLWILAAWKEKQQLFSITSFRIVSVNMKGDFTRRFVCRALVITAERMDF